MSVKKEALKILSEQPDQKMRIAVLGKELSKRGALGFGVEVDDVVNPMIGNGEVGYDYSGDSIYLLTNEELKLSLLRKEKIGWQKVECELKQFGLASGKTEKILSLVREKLKEIDEEIESLSK